MKIKIINPNTTLEMTESIRKMAESVCDSDTELLVVSPETGPASIEGYVDEYMAALGVVDEVIKGDKENCDAYIIACFGIPVCRQQEKPQTNRFWESLNLQCLLQR